MKLFVHPLTGEMLEATEEALQAAVNAAGKEIGRIARARDVLSGELAEIRGPAVLPRPALRTHKQHEIARCPRCAGEVHG